MSSRIQELVPEANVAFAHGQMRENQLEDIMYRFINGDIDVLVSTTIIETGLDISNVNTMIIHDADNMGLSQLYQLRGRVGRSNRTAYAFLMYRRNKMLKEVAEKRLAAIREYSDLGSGFKIAMRDLEIRGAGNLLGAEQSGHMEAVGYDLYCKMLYEAVKRPSTREQFALLGPVTMYSCSNDFCQLHSGYENHQIITSLHLLVVYMHLQNKFPSIYIPNRNGYIQFLQCENLSNTNVYTWSKYGLGLIDAVGLQ